jgi:hypothetical protein
MLPIFIKIFKTVPHTKKCLTGSSMFTGLESHSLKFVRKDIGATVKNSGCACVCVLGCVCLC